MLKSMSMHKIVSNKIIRFNFVTSCLAFKDSIPTLSELN